MGDIFVIYIDKSLCILIISQDISKVLKNVYIYKFWLGVGGGNHIYIHINFSQVQIILHCTRVCQKNNGTSFLMGGFP